MAIHAGVLSPTKAPMSLTGIAYLTRLRNAGRPFSLVTAGIARKIPTGIPIRPPAGRIPTRPPAGRRTPAKLPTKTRARGGLRLLIVAILLLSTAPLYAQRQQQNVAKLKADARNLVGIIGSDKTKTQTYCQIEDLTEQLDQAVQQKDIKKARALVEKIAELNKKMGPEFAALVDIEKRVDLNSPDGQEIASIVASLGESCPH